MMSLLTELDSFTLPFLQICQSYGLRRLRVLARQKIQMPNAPNVQRKMILARRSSHRANRKSARSAPVPGRSNVANQAAIETSKAHRRPSLAAAGDGRAPPAFRGSSGRESAPSKHRPQNNEPIHIGCHIRPSQSARGLAQSKTLRAIRASPANAPASWTAAALRRFLLVFWSG